MSAELERIWTLVQERLALAVGHSTYRTWLEPLSAIELAGGRLLVYTPPHTARWVSDRFGALLRDAAASVLEPGIEVELTSQPAADHAAGAPRPDLLGNPKLTFEQFVIGDCNRLAHAAALAVAEMPSHAYNPLFLCGPPGVGKTHLLNSIASLLLAHDPSLNVRLTTGETFTNEFLGALSANHTDAFKRRFRDVDVLLMDDVQFLERKVKTEEELFHTFNALHDSGRQIVLSSDRPPHDLQALEDRLRERFQAGLVADIAPPDLHTRIAILNMRVHRDGIPCLDPLALELIAERVLTNVRALEGALIRVVAYSSLTNRPLTAELARDVLDRLYPQPPTQPSTRSIADIQLATCRHFDITHDELISPSRAPRLSWPRHVAMYLARELTDESLPAIGRHFGGRDHTTVLHACRRTSTRIAAEDASRETIAELRRFLCDPDARTSAIPPRDRPA